MKVLLIKDVYKLGRAGEVKKVADGYGRNFLIPQKFAIPASEGALRMAKSIGQKATERRAVLNNELSSVADVLAQVKLMFSVKAGETGKLYGSVSQQMIVDEIKSKHNIDLDRRQIAMEPIRTLGEFQVPVQLTLDLVPNITVVITREGEQVAGIKTASEKVSQTEPTLVEESTPEEPEVPAEQQIEEETEEPAEQQIEE